MNKKLKRNRIDVISISVVREELLKVAKYFGYRKFSRHEFDDVAATCKGSTVLKHFGTWKKALDSLDVELKPHKANRKQISNHELLSELGRICVVNAREVIQLGV